MTIGCSYCQRAWLHRALSILVVSSTLRIIRVIGYGGYRPLFTLGMDPAPVRRWLARRMIFGLERWFAVICGLENVTSASRKPRSNFENVSAEAPLEPCIGQRVRVRVIGQRVRVVAPGV